MLVYARVFHHRPELRNENLRELRGYIQPHRVGTYIEDAVERIGRQVARYLGCHQ